MIFWPYAAFWPFLFSLKSCAGKSNATHPSKYVVNHQHHQTPRNSLKKLLQAIWAQIMNKNGKKWRILMKKLGFKTTSSHFLGTYELDFSCSSIFYQPWARLRHFKGKKVQLIFHPISAIFSPPGRLPKAITTPWKCPLRVPWWNTFQWGPRKPPKPFLEKKYFRPEILNYTPSPLCTGWWRWDTAPQNMLYSLHHDVVGWR